MSNRRIAVSASALALATASALLLAQAPGHADPAPQAGDIVGVGSDIVQSSVDFLADGAPGGALGYNSAGNKWRLFDFDAVADANGRNAFVDPQLATSRTLLNPTVQLRAGTSPVKRPNGGGAGLTALENDSAHYIDFARSPNLPKSQDQTNAHNNLNTYLHAVQFADDKQYVATSTDTYAPATLSAADLYNIYTGVYTKWSDVPGYSGGHGAQVIYAERPQDGAGVLTIFQNQILTGAPAGTTSVAWGQNVHQVQQNDPTTITSLPDGTRQNAIVPFPKGRFDLLGSGYFLNPNTDYKSSNYTDPAQKLGTGGIQLLVPGQASTGATAYVADIPYYIVFRESDVTSAETWQPGSDENWVRALFYDPSNGSDGKPKPFFASTAGQQLLTSIGLTPVYTDKGTPGH